MFNALKSHEILKEFYETGLFASVIIGEKLHSNQK